MDLISDFMHPYNWFKLMMIPVTVTLELLHYTIYDSYRATLCREQPKVSAALVAAASQGLAISQEDIGVWSRWSPRTSLRIVASVTSYHT